MSDLFSAQWMEQFKEAWNADEELTSSLARINFNSIIGYGFKDSDRPIGFIKIVNGKAVNAGSYDGQTLNWDLRASRESWEKWLSQGLNMMGLSMAYMKRNIVFPVGDYGAMIKDPRMAGPFVKSFAVMGRVPTHSSVS
jgi:hypothetical protein